MKLITGFTWHFLGSLTIKFSGFFIGIFLARLLEPKDFGIIAMALVVNNIANTIAKAGLGAALIQREELEEKHYSTAFYANLALSILIYLLVWFTAPLISTSFELPELGLVIQVLALVLILEGLNIVQFARYSRVMDFKKITLARTISSMFSGIAAIIMAINGFGFWSLVFQLVLASCLYTVILFYFSPWLPKVGFNKIAFRQLWSFGGSMYAASLLGSVTSQLNTVLIGKFFTMGQLGYYNRAIGLNKLTTKLSSESMQVVTFPALSKLQKSPKLFHENLKRYIDIVAVVSIGMALALFIFSEPLIRILYGQKWIETIPMFKIVVLGSFGYPINLILLNGLRGMGKSSSLLVAQLIKFGTYFTITIAAFLLFGFYGILWGSIVVMFLGTIINMIFVNKIVPGIYKSVGRPLLSYIILFYLICSIYWFVEQSVNGVLLYVVGVCLIALFIYLLKLLKSAGYVELVKLIEKYTSI